ncbi:hypothetical protein [Azospirillum doebereinerae]
MCTPLEARRSKGRSGAGRICLRVLWSVIRRDGTRDSWPVCCPHCPSAGTGTAAKPRAEIFR